jgi:hypothetical protein
MDGFQVSAYAPEFFGQRLYEPQHGNARETRQQELEVICMMRAHAPAGDESCGEFAEGHVRVGFDDLKPPVVDFLF